MARRVNRKFLLILTLIVVGVLGALVIGGKYLSRQNPAKYEQAGDQFMKEGDYDSARSNYGQAYSLDQNNADLLVKYGRALAKMALSDPVYMGQDIAAWRHALEVSPDNADAMRELVNAYRDIADLAPSMSNFQSLRDMAGKLSKVDPSDADAQATVHLATIEAWLSGLQTDPRMIEENLKALQALHEKDPSNAEVPYYIALANLQKARDAGNLNDYAAAVKLAEAAHTMFVEAIKKQPSNVAMYYRGYQIDRMLSQISSGTNAAAQQQKAQETDTQAREWLMTAQKLVKPDNELYVTINTSAADDLLRRNDRPGAEKILRATLAAQPADPEAQMALARLLGTDAQTRPEAIALLADRKTRDQAETRKAAMRARQYQILIGVELTGLQIDQYAQTHDAKARKELLAQIDDGYDKLMKQVGEVPDVLKLRGRLELAQDENVKAIQTLEKVQQLLSQQGRQDFQVKYLLARVYLKAHQTGEAKKLLNQIIRRFPEMTEARLLLAQQLLKEHDMAEAAPQLEALRKLIPNTPQLTLLELASLDPKKDAAKAQALYTTLPEKTSQNKLDKARIAVQLGRQTDAVKLLEEVNGQNPGDPEVVNLLGRIYVSENQKPQAVALVEAALKVNPDNQTLVALKKVFEGATASEIIQLETDPLTRELNMAELAIRTGDRKAASEHLAKAAAIKPDDPRVMSAQFDEAVSTGQWDAAKTVADKLAAVNQDQANGRLIYFRLAMARKDLKKARSLAEELTAQMPEFSQSWIALAQVMQAQGQFNDALSKYVSALDRQSDNLQALNGLIECYVALNRPQAAHDAIIDAIQKFPANRDLQEQLTRWQLTYGNPVDALPAREAAVKQSPNNAVAYMALGGSYLRVAQVEGAKDAASGQAYVKKAKDIFEQAKTKWPDLSDAYAHLAEIAMSEDQAPVAEAILKELAARDAWRNKPQPQLMLAALYEREGKSADAEAALKQAHALAKDDFGVTSQLATFLAGKGQLDEALKLLPTDSPDAQVQRRRIELQVAGGRLADAQKAIEAQLKTDPNSVSWRTLLGFVYMHSQKLAEARQQFDLVLAADLNNVGALYYRGLLKMSGDKPDLGSALDDLTNARNANPNNLDVRLALADALQRNRDTQGAVSELEAAIRIAPTSKTAYQRLIDLYASADPPRWSDADRVIAQAREVPQLAEDPDVLYQVAGVRARQGKTAESLAAIELARRYAPTSPAVIRAQMEILLKAGKSQQVIDETNKLLVKHESWWLRLLRAEAKARSNDKAGAMTDYEAAVANLDAVNDLEVTTRIVQSVSRELGQVQAIDFARKHVTESPRWYIELAYLHQGQQQLAEARQAVDAALADVQKLKPNERVAALRMSAMLYMNGTKDEYAKARQAYQDLLALSPNDLPALNNLACLLADSITPPQPKEALQYSSRAYDLMTKAGRWDPLIADTQGWVLSRNGSANLPEAIRILADVVERSPFPEARYHLAEAYLLDGKPDQAQKQLDQAVVMLNQVPKDKQQEDAVLRTRIQQAVERIRAMQSKADVRQVG